MSSAAFDVDNNRGNFSPTPSEVEREKRKGISFLTNKVLNSPKGEVVQTIADRLSNEHKFQQKLEEFTYGSKEAAGAYK